MLLMLAVILLFLVKVKKYEYKPLFAMWQTQIVLALQVILFLIQTGVLSGIDPSLPFRRISTFLLMLSYLPLIRKLKLHKAAFLGLFFSIIGSFLNRFVISQNGGFMPVFPILSHYFTIFKRDPSVFNTDIHILGDASVKYKILTDFIDVGYAVLSIGDLMIHGFGGFVLYYALKTLNTPSYKEEGADNLE